MCGARFVVMPGHYRDLMADGTANGITQSALYRARRRLGLVAADGFWALPEPVAPNSS